MKIYTVRIDTIEKHIFDELLFYVSSDERERILRFKRYEDALRGLMSKILLRFIIISLLGTKNNSICYDKNEYGKPYLSGVDDFHFNISHSGDWVVCAVDNLPVGIDVEKIHDVDLNLSARFFSEEEHKYLLSLEISKRRNSFFELWTLKESYIKADGRGLSIPLNSFSFKFANKDIVFTTTNQFNECYFKQYDIDTSYKLAVCSSKSDFPKELTDISFDSIYSLVKEHLEKLEI